MDPVMLGWLLRIEETQALLESRHKELQKYAENRASLESVLNGELAKERELEQELLWLKQQHAAQLCSTHSAERMKEEVDIRLKDLLELNTRWQQERKFMQKLHEDACQAINAQQGDVADFSKSVRKPLEEMQQSTQAAVEQDQQLQAVCKQIRATNDAVHERTAAHHKENEAIAAEVKELKEKKDEKQRHEEKLLEEHRQQMEGKKARVEELHQKLEEFRTRHNQRHERHLELEAKGGQLEKKLLELKQQVALFAARQ